MATQAPAANQGFPGATQQGNAATTSGLESFGPFGFETSAWQRGNIISDAGSGTIALGADIAAVFGLPPDTRLSMSALLEEYSKASSSQIRQLQSILSAAGMFTDANGTPMSNPPTSGLPDDQTYAAFGNALLQTLQSGNTSTVSDVLVNRAAMGAGTASQQQAMGAPTVQGGNVYQIDLTSPTDMAYAAHQIFQTALGRNPTQAELARLTASQQGEETTYQQARNQQREAASQSMYQATVSAKQAQLAPQATAGPVPNGPFKDIYQWAAGFLQYMGGGTDLLTPSNIAMIVAWANSVGSAGKNNPLGVTLAAPGSTQTAGGTAQSAQNYAQPADGMRAALQTLQESFPLLLSALKGGDASAVLGQKAVQDELKQWSNGANNGDITKQAQAQTNKATAASQQYGGHPTAATAAAGAAPAQPVPSAAVGTSQEAKLSQASAQAAASRTSSTVANATQTGLPALAAAAANDPTGAVAATLQAGANDPTVGAYLTQQYNLAHGIGSSLAPATADTGQQPIAPGSQYVAPTTLTDVTPPSADANAWQAATTGANQIPYEGYQYLQAFNAIMQMIHPNVTQGM